jgi:hypothetical protein
MPQRTTKQILAEWHELAERQLEASDTDLRDAISARIAEVRREYIEGTPAPPPTVLPDALEDESPEQTRLPF